MRRRRLLGSASAWCVGWAKRSVPTIKTSARNGGHASLCPPYGAGGNSTHLEPDRQLFRAVDKIGLCHLDLAVEGNRFQPRQQFFEQDAHFQFRQILPETEMRAVAE